MNTDDTGDRGSVQPESGAEVADLQSVECEGRTVEEAVETACEQLGVTQDQVDIEVFAEPRSGLFGIGSASARVRVTVRSDEDLPTQVLGTLLDLMGIESEISRYEDDDEVFLSVESPDAALLIGRRGKCLNSLQFLVNRMISRKERLEKRIVVDVDGYRERRSDSLAAMAERQAEKARRTRREVRLQPLDPQDRRSVHMALRDDPAVETHSIGEGIYRTVVISPVKSGRRRGQGSRDNQ